MPIHAAQATATAAHTKRATPVGTVGVRDQIHATTRALIAAEEAQLAEGVKSVEWERRGLLGRLVRRTRG
jgi:hypothetical protein